MFTSRCLVASICNHSPRPAPPRPPPQSSPSQGGAARLPKTEIALYSQDSNSRNQGCRYTSRNNNYHQLKAISLLANPSLPMIVSQQPAARHMSWCDGGCCPAHPVWLVSCCAGDGGYLQVPAQPAATISLPKCADVSRPLL